MKFQFTLLILLSVMLIVKSKPISVNKKEIQRKKRQGFADLFGYNGNFNPQSGSNNGFGTNGFNSNLGAQSNNFASANQQINSQNSNGFGANSYGNGFNSNQPFNNFQNSATQNQNNLLGSNQNQLNNFQNSFPQNQNQLNNFQNNPQQKQNNAFGNSQNQYNQLGNFQNNQGYAPFYGATTRPVPVIDPVVMSFTTTKKVSGTTDSNKSSGIPVFTIEAPKENYSKSFDPYFGMTTRKIPKTPQAYWFSRYYGFTAPIAAIPFSNYNRI